MEKLRLAWIAALSLACASCSKPWASVEERINDAIPLSAAAAENKARLVERLKDMPEQRERIEAELDTRMKMRALSCAQGNEPSFIDTADDIRDKLSADCFRTFDAELAAWMGSRRVHMLLLAPPLRPIAEQLPAILTSANSVVGFEFASEAGVAVVGSAKGMEVIDTGTNELIQAHPHQRWRGSLAFEVSPNGRVIACIDAAGVLVFVDAESGEMMAEYPDFRRFRWLDNVTALVFPKGGNSQLMDFATGRMAPVRGFPDGLTAIFPIPGDSTQFLQSGGSTLTKYHLRRTESGPQVTAVKAVTAEPGSYGSNFLSAAVTPRYFVSGSRSLTVTDLNTMQTDTVQLPGVSSAPVVAALPDTDEVLIHLPQIREGSGQALAVLSLADRTFALAEGVPDSGYMKYFPSHKRLVLVSGKTMTLVDSVARGPALGPELFAQLIEETRQEWKQRQAAEAAKRMGYTPAGTVNNVPVMPGPLLELSRDAQIEAIGVYEGRKMEGERPGAGAGPGARRDPRPVMVVVRRAPKPIVLVLTSYDPVSWNLRLEPGAQLKAVLLASYEPSAVYGAGTARVTQMGRFYAYERGSDKYRRLQEEVTRWTGKSIDVFQGSYTGSVFTVGGM